jgi:hypothetical protein
LVRLERSAVKVARCVLRGLGEGDLAWLPGGVSNTQHLSEVQTMNEHNQTVNADIPPPVAMLQLIAGFWVSRAIYIAAKLGIANLLKDGPRRSEELAAATGTHAPSLYRVLRALASVGVFAEDDQGRFALTPLGATLQTGVPGSLRAYATMMLGEEKYPAWGNMLHSVQTGEIAFDHLFGMNVWQYRAQHPREAQIFDEAMADLTAVATGAILASYDFSPIGTLVDVGGGNGGLMAALLKANPRMKGILFDAPHVVAGARRRMEAEGLTERCEILAGDFLASAPSGGDTYVLKNIIVDWDEERSLGILRNCHRAMTAQGKLLIIEPVILPGTEHSFRKFTDLVMLVMNGGRVRTEAEHRALLAAAGFRLTRLIPTPSEMSVIEAVPA